MSDDTYEVLAVSYAKHNRRTSENFLGGDPHDGPMPLDYFTWILRNEHRTVLVDTGFDQRGAELRKRTITRPVAEGLKAAGVELNSVQDVVISHMHYDHAGNNDLFPNARYHLQDAEMAYATGRCMCHATMSHVYEVEDVTSMVRRVYAGRVAFHRGDAEIFPGISVHHIGGHARGLQAVRVKTRRGHVVVASDSTHHYRHFLERRVFPVVDSVADVLEGYDRLEELATSVDHVIPGHDPLIAELYPAATSGPGQPILRLDAEPRRSVKP